MSKRMLTTFVAASVGVLFLYSPVVAATPDVSRIEELVQKYGKENIISYIRDNRGNYVTILVSGQMKDFLGPPNPEYVTASTILQDMKKMGSSIQNFEDSLAKHEEIRTEEQAERVRENIRRMKEKEETNARLAKEVKENEAMRREQNEKLKEKVSRYCQNLYGTGDMNKYSDCVDMHMLQRDLADLSKSMESLDSIMSDYVGGLQDDNRKHTATKRCQEQNRHGHMSTSDFNDCIRIQEDIIKLKEDSDAVTYCSEWQSTVSAFHGAHIQIGDYVRCLRRRGASREFIRSLPGH